MEALTLASDLKTRVEHITRLVASAFRSGPARLRMITDTVTLLPGVATAGYDIRTKAELAAGRRAVWAEAMGAIAKTRAAAKAPATERALRSRCMG